MRTLSLVLLTMTTWVFINVIEISYLGKKLYTLKKHLRYSCVNIYYINSENVLSA